MSEILNIAAFAPPIQHDLTELSRLLAELEGALARTAGVASKPTTLRVWQDFAAKSEAERTGILDSLRQSVELLTYAARQGERRPSSKQLTWHALKYMSLHGPANLFHLIEDDDYIEVYNAQGVQIFRDIEFYKLISYSIAEITVYRWDELFERDDAVKHRIMADAFGRGFSGVTEPFSLAIDAHPVREAFSPERWTYRVSFGYVSPLFDSDQRVKAILATSKVVRT